MRKPAHRRPSSHSGFLIVILAAIVLATGSVLALTARAAAPARTFPARAAAAVAPAARVRLTAPEMPPAVRPAPPPARAYTVRPGDYLSAIAVRLCGRAGDWTGIYAASRAAHLTARDADYLAIGQHLVISCIYLPGELKYAGPPPVITTVTIVKASLPAGSDDDSEDVPAVTAAGPGSHQAAITYHGSGSMQQCIITRESGGDSQVMNSTGHYGLYQFSASTWASHGGNPADFGHASVAEQNAVYYATVAADGYSDWAPYDGCL